MRSQAELIAAKFDYQSKVNRKLDQIRGSWGRAETYHLVWYYKETPIAISCRSGTLGRFIKLFWSQPLKPPVVDRFNAIFRRFSLDLHIRRDDHKKWVLIDARGAQPQDTTINPWPGRLVLRVTVAPHVGRFQSIDQRLLSLYGHGKNR
jgi:hypothetical protein